MKSEEEAHKQAQATLNAQVAADRVATDAKTASRETYMGETVKQMTAMNQCIADIQAKAAAAEIRADATALSLTNAMALQKKSTDEQFAKMMAAILALSNKEPTPIISAAPDGAPLVAEQNEAAASSDLAVVPTAGAGKLDTAPHTAPPKRALPCHPSNESATGEAPFHKSRLVGENVATAVSTSSSVPMAGQTS